MDNLTPSEFYLSQNYPNPFSERTVIKFCVPYKTRVKFDVFTSEGKRLETLLDEEREAGTYEVEFSTKKLVDGSAVRGNASNLPDGMRGPSERIYVYRFQAGDFSATKNMLLQRA